MRKFEKYFWHLVGPTVLLLAYAPTIRKLFIRWNSGDNSYCYLIPPLFFYLCWEKRKTFNFGLLSGSYEGIALIVLAIGINFLGELSSLEILFYFGFWLSIVALGLIFYGRRLRELAFPFIILLFMIPLPPFINRLLTFRLQILTSALVVSLMRLSGLSVFREGNIIDLGVAQLQVVEACGGLRYFMPLVLLALLMDYYVLRRWWSRALLLALVPLVSVVANAFRIFLLGLLYFKGLREWAEGFSHYFAGWLVFILAGGLLFLVAVLLRQFEGRIVKEESVVEPKKMTSPPKSFPVLVSLFSLIVVAGGVGFRFFPKTFIVPTKASLAVFPMKIDGWQGERLRLSSRILESLWADDYVYSVYCREGFPGSIYLLIPYYSYQTTWHTAHAPQSCLLGSGWAILKSGDWKLKVSPTRVVPIRYIWLEKRGQRLLAAYFFLQRGRVITSPWWHKFYLFWDAITRRRTDGALVRIEMLLASEIAPREAERELKKFVVYLWPELVKFIPD